MGKGSNQPLRILFSCVGRRVELVQAFRAAAERLGRPIILFGADTTATAPALSCVDQPLLLPPISSDAYLPKLLELCAAHEIDALIPTIDTDLAALSAARDDFAKLGCTCLIADARVINICRDKVATFDFLAAAGIDTPRTYLPEQMPTGPDLRFPYFIKPRYGSASMWVHRLDDETDLAYHLQKVRDPIVQEFVDGVEHTLDVYVGLSGVPQCVVPRARWQVRGGEVSKGVVVKDLEVMEAGRRVVEALGGTVRGVVTLQCIVTADRRIRFIEINPRFGGGAPLGIAAGADYPAWLIEELGGGSPAVTFDGFRHGTCMLRYDWSVFVNLGQDLAPELKPPLWPAPRYEQDAGNA